MKQEDLPHQSVGTTHQQTVNVVGFRGSILVRVTRFHKKPWSFWPGIAVTVANLMRSAR